VCEHGAKNHLGVYCLSHDFLSIWWSVLTGFDDRFGIDSLNLRLRLELLSAFSKKKAVQSPTWDATHLKAWISLAPTG